MSTTTENTPETVVSTKKTPGRFRRALTDRSIINLFIWPTLIILIAFNVFPLFYSLFLSFTDYSAIAGQAPVWVGLENFNRVLFSERMWEGFTITGRYVILSVSLELVLGFALALLIREQFRGSGLITTLILIPMMLSPVVVGLFLEADLYAHFWLLQLPVRFQQSCYGSGLAGQSFCGAADAGIGALGRDHCRHLDVDAVCGAAHLLRSESDTGLPL